MSALKSAAMCMAVIASLFFVSAGANAGERQAFSTTKFEKAQAAGSRILVDIAASWCPVCKAQKPLIEEIAAEPANDDLIIFEVDFDTQKDAVRGFNAQKQSTLIAYHGKTETKRSVGDTNSDSISSLIASNRDK